MSNELQEMSKDEAIRLLTKDENPVDVWNQRKSFTDRFGRSIEIKVESLKGVDFSGIDLRPQNNSHGIFFDYMDFSKVNFSDAKLNKAKFNAAILEGTIFFAADLSDAQFRNAKLQSANFRHATLVQAYLTTEGGNEAIGAAAYMFGGANLLNTELPRYLKDAFSGPLINVEHTCKYVRPIFFGMLTVCLCLVLGVLGQGADNDAKFRIPILGFALTKEYFFYVGIIFVASCYIYLHLYLKHLWEVLSGLPAYFSDGTALHRRAHPWLMVHIVQWFFPQLRKNEQIHFYSLSVAVPIILAWVAPVLAVVFCCWTERTDVFTLPVVITAIMGITGLVAFVRMYRILRYGTKRKRVYPQIKQIIKEIICGLLHKLWKFVIVVWRVAANIFCRCVNYLRMCYSKARGVIIKKSKN